MERALGRSSHYFVDNLAILNKNDGGNVSNAKLGSEFVVFVDIAAADDDASVVFVGQFVDDRTNSS